VQILDEFKWKLTLTFSYQFFMPSKVALHQLLVRRQRRTTYQKKIAKQALLFWVHPLPAQGELNNQFAPTKSAGNTL
jgi:hypothetical protein